VTVNIIVVWDVTPCSLGLLPPLFLCKVCSYPKTLVTLCVLLFEGCIVTGCNCVYLGMRCGY
jgi:hypothetical protein